MSLEITGKIIQALPEQSGTSRAGNAWRKREYILETQDAYPKKVCFNLFGDRIDQFPINIGDTVTASVDIESREFNGRWYTDVRAFNIRKDEVLPQPPAGGPNPPVPTDFPPAPADLPAAGPAEDLPF